MANLGTLWFGADIDLSGLKQKIGQGNQQVLDALKISYDPKSYLDMVSDIRSRLSKEAFEIKIDANTQGLAQNIRQQLGRGSGLTGGLDELNEKIKQQTIAVSALQSRLERLLASYKSLKDRGMLMQANTLGSQITALKKELSLEKQTLRDFNAQRDALRRASQDTILNLRREAAEQRRAAAEAKKAATEKSNAVRQLNSDHIRLNTTLAGGIHISTQLGSALSSVFAVHAARQFLGNVIEIGGQLEKQRISIGAILGDTVKANHLFEQIKGLALKSPFGVVELDQYTKQLSAYGFKYNELFDMTKRLADISAGAGTDIGRLTLALGHVRSATYLTGITLRQFSMNNIPMLKMLADYYSEVEKHAVSTAEVQKRISKRQVSYEDVIEQIRRLTNEGGMFYNMQEKISESLAAKFKNLKDALDIMYGEIAEGQIGDVMKGVADVLLKATRHWKEIGVQVGIAGGAFVASRMAIAMQTMALQANTAASVKQIVADKQVVAAKLRQASLVRELTVQEKALVLTSNQLRAADIKRALSAGTLTKEEALRLITLKKIKIAQAMHLAGVEGITKAEIQAAAAAKVWRAQLAGIGVSIKNAFAGIGKGFWITMGLMAGSELWMAYDQWKSRIEDKANEMKDLIKSRVLDLEKLRKSLESDGKPTDTLELKNRVDEMKQVLANSEAYTKTLDEQLKKAGSLPKQYDILAEAIDNVIEKNRKALDYQDAIAEMIKASTGDFMSTNYSENLDYFFNDDITQNIKQTLDAYKNLRAVIDGAWEYRDAIEGVIEKMIEQGDISDSFAERLRSAPFEEQIALLVESGKWDKLANRISSSDSGFLKFAKNIKEASKGVVDNWDEIANDDIPRMIKKEASRRKMTESAFKEWCLANVDDFKMMLEGIADQLDAKEPAIRRHLKTLFYNYVRFGQLRGFTGQLAARVMGAMDKKLQALLQEDETTDLTDEPLGDNVDPSGSKTDKILEGWKNRYDALKTYYDEVQKYIKLGYDVRSAMEKVKELGLGDMSIFGGMEATRDNYAVLLRKLLQETNGSTTQREQFQRTIKTALGDFERDGTKEAMDKNVALMKEYVKQVDAQWKLYRDVMRKTGNRELAQLAFSDEVMWDDVSRKLKEEFSKKVTDRGLTDVSLFRWTMNDAELKEVLRDADGLVQTDLVELAQKIRDIIRSNYQNFIKDSADAYSKALSHQEQLNELLRQRNELERERDTTNNSSEAVQKGYQVRIDALDRQIADKRWDAFKEANDWGRVFGNLDRMSTETLRSMLQKLKEVAPTIDEGTESTKALYEAIEQIEQVMTQRNPFATIVSSAQQLYRLRQLANNMKEQGSITTDAKSAKYYGLKANRKYTYEEIKDLLKNASTDFTGGLEGLASSFKSVQDVLQPVIDLFDALGNTQLSDFLSMGSNALGAATQVAGGLNALGLGSAGPYGAAAAAALSVASSLIGKHDESLQKEIEASEQRQKEMETLSKNLEQALKRSLSSIYNLKASDRDIKALRDSTKVAIFGNQYDRSYISGSTKAAVKEAEQSRSYYDSAYASLLVQRDELQHQLQLEEEKKDSDAGRMSDYKQQLRELDEDIISFAKDMAESLYGIDFKGWAEDLAGTLVDAWASGEDAAEAYKKKVSEILKGLGVKMIAERFIADAITPIMDEFLKQYSQDDGVLTTQSMAILAKMYEAGEELQAQTADFMDGINKLSEQYGADMKDIEGEQKTSASASIKSITEDTADLLAGYINAIRADVSVIRMQDSVYYPQILAAVGRSHTIAETQVMYLQQVADNTRRNADSAAMIYDLLRGNTMNANKWHLA